MKICSLASGSRGNSIFIESNDTRILIDAGLSALKIKNGLLELGVEPDTIDAIVITHAHRDHVSGAGVFSRQFGTPIWGHPQTLDYLMYLFKKNQPIYPWESEFSIKNIMLSPFLLSHDAIPTVGYRISENDKKIAVCTDLGVVTQEVEESLKEVDLLVIESNHDPELLKNGPYPLELKLRISSDVGHLSNHDTGLLLKKVLHKNLQKILLAHLSDENNTHELARNTVLEHIGPQFEDLIEIFGQREISPIFEI